MLAFCCYSSAALAGGNSFVTLTLTLTTGRKDDDDAVIFPPFAKRLNETPWSRIHCDLAVTDCMQGQLNRNKSM